MKINLPENFNLYYQAYCQEVPPTKINSLENLKMKISRITVAIRSEHGFNIIFCTSILMFVYKAN